MLVALPTQPSFGLAPIVPLFSSPFSVTSVPSVLKSPRNPATQPTTYAQQPTRFPLFPHPVNITHTPTPANPFSSIVYFTVLCTRDFSRVLPSPIAPSPSHTPINPLDATLTKRPANVDSKQLTQSLNPLNATLTKKQGGRCRPERATHYSLLTTHCPSHSATLFPIKRHDS
jgi:hypothetical protein